MNIIDALTSRLYKWVILSPGVRKIVNWAYSDIFKLPQYHIALSRGSVGAYVLLVEDAAEVLQVASHLSQAEESASHREYLTFSGMLDGVRVSVTSTGMGGPSTAIAIEELAVAGANTFIFLGAGRWCIPPLKAGDLMIATSAVRDEGTGLQYLPPAFPALADVRVAACLQQACHSRRLRCHSGTVHSVDAYFSLQRSMDSSTSARNIEHHAGVLCYDLNSAAIFLVSTVLGKKAGALLAAADRDGSLNDEQIEAALEALRLLMELDRQK